MPNSYNILKPSSFCLHPIMGVGIATTGHAARMFCSCSVGNDSLSRDHSSTFTWIDHTLQEQTNNKCCMSRPTESVIQAAIRCSTSFREYCLSKELIRATTAVGCDSDIDKPSYNYHIHRGPGVGVAKAEFDHCVANPPKPVTMHSHFSILKPSSFCLVRHGEVGVVNTEHLAGDVFSRYPGDQYLNNITATKIQWMGYEMYTYSTDKHIITRPTEAQVISTLIAHPKFKEYCIEQGLVSVTRMPLHSIPVDPLDDIAAGLADFRTRINTDVKAHRIAVNIHVEYITEIKKLQCALQMYQTRLT